MGIADRRGLSLRGYLSSDLRESLLSGFELSQSALRFKSSDNKLVVSANIGIFGYYSGLDKIIIDKFASSDPLLAGMPVSGMWRIGHFQRRIPDGYIESILNDSEIIEEKKLNEYYKRLRLITQGKRLLSRERLKTILLFNLHYYDHLLERDPL